MNSLFQAKGFSITSHTISMTYFSKLSGLLLNVVCFEPIFGGNLFIGFVLRVSLCKNKFFKKSCALPLFWRNFRNLFENQEIENFHRIYIIGSTGFYFFNDIFWHFFLLEKNCRNRGKKLPSRSTKYTWECVIRDSAFIIHLKIGHFV